MQRDESAPTVLWSDQPWLLEPEEQSSVSPPVLAVVGSRACSRYGLLAVQTLIPGFTRRYNATIVSGGAPGIDLAAHQAAQQVGQPTWVVLGCGLNHLPARLRRFSESPSRIITPFPPWQAPQKWSFPLRNHVIAQLSHGVLVVEAAEKSGSLITAAAALEYGRELMVVLPPFSSPNAAGAMRLLQQGASPVASEGDLAQTLGLSFNTNHQSSSKKESSTLKKLIPQERELYEILQKNGGIFPLVELFSQLNSSTHFPSLPASVLTALELRGVVKVELGVVRLASMVQS